MINAYFVGLFEALYAPVYEIFNSGVPNKSFNLEADTSYRSIDGNDPRNFLLNLIDTAYKNLLLITPRLNGLQIGRVYSTSNGSPRVTYSVVFTFKDTKSNTLLDEPSLEALIPPTP